MNIQEITNKIEQVADRYSKDFDIEYTDDWFLLKLQEEFGEMTRAHLMLTHRTRRKISSEQEGKEALAEEVADVFAYILLFAQRMDIDIQDALTKKWFQFLKK